MRVVVTGSRELSEKHRGVVEGRLDAWLERAWATGDPLVVIHGGCPTGADAFAAAWARDKNVPTFVYPADWARFGHSAGPKRNARMARDSQADAGEAFVLAGLPCRGTWHCVHELSKNLVPVRITSLLP